MLCVVDYSDDLLLACLTASLSAITTYGGKLSHEKNVEPSLVPTSLPIEELFAQGFEGHSDVDHHLDFVTDDQSPVSLPVTHVAPTQNEVGPSNRGMMKQVVIEVPQGFNLLNKPDRAAIWLKPWIGPIER